MKRDSNDVEPLCLKCEHRKPEVLGGNVRYLCVSKEAKILFFDITSEYPLCKAMRTSRHYCGKLAKWFDLKK